MTQYTPGVTQEDTTGVTKKHSCVTLNTPGLTLNTPGVTQEDTPGETLNTPGVTQEDTPSVTLNTFGVTLNTQYLSCNITTAVLSLYHYCFITVYTCCMQGVCL